MNGDLISYRQLELSDINHYSKLIMDNKIQMDEPASSISLEEAKLIFTKRATNPYMLQYGAFDENNRMIGTLSGFMPEQIPFWYSFDLLYDTNLLSNNYHIAQMISLNLFNPLITYAESKGKVRFHTRKSIRQQMLWEKILARTKKKLIKENTSHLYKFLQYNHHYELIYKAGEKCKYASHDFYFKGLGRESFAVDTIIVQHSSNLENSKKLLNLL